MHSSFVLLSSLISQTYTHFGGNSRDRAAYNVPPLRFSRGCAQPAMKSDGA